MRQGRLAGALIAAGLLLGPAPARAEALADWLGQVAACAGKRELTLAVIGFEAQQQVLSRSQADELRLAVESRLLAQGGVRLAASADVVRLKSLRESLNLQGPGEAEAQIRRAFAGDASVFLTEPSRQGSSASFRLQAIAGPGACKVTSEPIALAVQTAPGVVDIDAMLGQAVAKLAEAAPEMAEVEICPVQAAGGHSACAAALGSRLLLALDAEARSDRRVLASRPLAIRKAPARACGPSGPEAAVRASGRLEQDREGRSWLELEFRRVAAVLATSGRNRISVEALGCDPAIRPLLEHVAATAASDRARLAVLPAATPFARGRRLDIRIEGEPGSRLYCWVLAPDGTASVVLPVRGAERQAQLARSGRSYPHEFGLDDIVLEQPFENLFGCFGSQGELPAGLSERWLAAAPSASADAAVLAGGEVLELLEAMRAVPGIVEASAPLIVR